MRYRDRLDQPYTFIQIDIQVKYMPIIISIMPSSGDTTFRKENVLANL